MNPPFPNPVLLLPTSYTLFSCSDIHGDNKTSYHKALPNPQVESTVFAEGFPDEDRQGCPGVQSDSGSCWGDTTLTSHQEPSAERISPMTVGDCSLGPSGQSGGRWPEKAGTGTLRRLRRRCRDGMKACQRAVRVMDASPSPFFHVTRERIISTKLAKDS